ncbi:sodium:solute symporter family protein [Marine Group I thaumarchaeote]|uniref:Sodium:solute symporter family protein n=1 Tax=Marine Group I thaumarchaeote TaxID=2511932 RepID=A0A7K4NLF0_9ARCH|nr:sodium:solute symporter family protein [Marine Group I thaumarchaeote]
MLKISLLAVLLVFVVGTGVIFAVPDAAGDVVAGKGEFRLGEVLDESVGWFIVVGLGLIFAGVISVEIKLEEKYLGHTQNSEWFNTAGRIIKTGLTAAAIVSAWTWAATLLQSSTVAYLYGISGPFWYASGATIQVLLFGILAIELKRKAPNAHTFLEIIRARFGNGTHKIFLGFALTCNMIVTGMLLLGGAAVVNGLTGMDITIAAFLIPVGVMIYTLVGGLKATFVADYMHTVIIFTVILTFVSMVFFISPITGGIEGMFDKLAEAAVLKPVLLPTFVEGTPGNAMGAYLTMASAGGLIFGVINIVGNFGTVFVDQAYWQRAIAAQPSSTVRGFLLGGMCWFSIPFTLATTMGLTAVALQVSLTPEQVQLGLTVPAAATVLMGPVGAIMVLVMLFMAVTSAGSAELIAVSSLITYDVYRTYKNPNATGKQLLKVSRTVIVIFGLGMGALAAILLGMGLSLGFVYLAMGILIGSAVIPIALTIAWSRTTRAGAVSGALVGVVLALITWTGVASAESGGVVDIASLGGAFPMLYGNVVAILSSGLICVVISLAQRKVYDWKLMNPQMKIIQADMSESVKAEIAARAQDEETLKKAYKFSLKGGGILTLICVVFWPLPLYFSGYVFDLGFYTFWVWIAIVWVSVASFTIIVMPIYEARGGFAKVFRGQKADVK